MDGFSSAFQKAFDDISLKGMYVQEDTECLI